MAAPAHRWHALEALAIEAGQMLEDATPQEALSWSVNTFGAGFCIAASMADAVLIDMVS